MFSIFILFISSFAKGVEIQSSIEMTALKETNADFVNLKSGEPFQLNKGEAAYFVPAGSLPFFIFYPSSENSKINLNPLEMKKISDKQITHLLGQGVQEVITGLRKAEQLMSKKDYTQALNHLLPLKEKYPQVSSVYFLSASLNMLTKNTSQALEDLKKGLNFEPENETAKKLLNELQGTNK